MQCISPMFRIYHKYNPDITGKVISRAEAINRITGCKGIENPFDFIKDENFIRKLNKFEDNQGYGIQQIPCGKCYACRINYAAEWASRVMLESEYYENNYWVTLTYNESHVPINTDTGHNSLLPKDVTLFIKRLRKYMSDRKRIGSCRYFYCGEYGGITYRPHYHLILLDCPLNTNDFYGAFIDPHWFKEHWHSREIDQLWSEVLPGLPNKKENKTNMGMSEVTPLEWSNAAYTARYCMKKIFEENMLYDQWEVNKEFVNMSNGIGKIYYEDHKDEIWRTDSIVMKTVKGNIGNARPPKYFLDQLKKEDPERANWILERRREHIERKNAMALTRSDYTDLEKLIIDAEKIKQKAELLPREM